MTEVNKNLVRFQWEPAPHGPHGYLWQTSTYQDGATYVRCPADWQESDPECLEELHVPWQVPGIGQEFELRVQGVRYGEDGTVTELGPLSEWSDPVTIIPVPEPNIMTAILWGICLLWVLVIRRRR